MVKQVKNVDPRPKFNFYTYHPVTGNDIIIPIYAENEDEAWEKFDEIYGKDTPVDKIVKV